MFTIHISKLIAAFVLFIVIPIALIRYMVYRTIEINVNDDEENK